MSPQAALAREVVALPLPGSQVTHPFLLILALLVLVATVVYWFSTTSGDDEAGERSGGPSVSINVDPVRCARFGYCEHEAPDVFQIRREGRLTYKSQVPADEIDPVIRAVEVCPARAISLGRVRGRR